MTLLIFEAGDGGELTLFLIIGVMMFGFGADTDFPVWWRSCILIFEIMEESGLDKHEFFEMEVMEGEIGMDGLFDVIFGDDGAEWGGLLVLVNLWIEGIGAG